MGSVIAVLGLLVSVATAIAGYRHGRRVEEAQRLRDEREREERGRRAEEAARVERRRQASWIQAYAEAGGRRYTVHNGSSQPITDVRVGAVGGPLLSPDDGQLLLPGRAVTVPAPTDEAGRAVAERNLFVVFTDVTGRTWRRSALGYLQERVSAPDGPPAWGPSMPPLIERFQPPPAPPPTGPPEGPPTVRHTDRPSLGQAERPPGRPTRPPVFPADSRPGAGSVLRSRPAIGWRALFVLGCLGAAAAVSYLLAQLF
ncbi:hypothetical protein [Streptomyces sp. NPDC047928]